MIWFWRFFQIYNSKKNKIFFLNPIVHPTTLASNQIIKSEQFSTHSISSVVVRNWLLIKSLPNNSKKATAAVVEIYKNDRFELEKQKGVVATKE